jgi:predicted DNA-binding transcriptional regulator AlpA
MELLDTVKTAQMLGLHPTTLATWRVEGRGPRFIKIGERKVRYRQDDIDHWLESNTRTSTREPR